MNLWAVIGGSAFCIASGLGLARPALATELAEAERLLDGGSSRAWVSQRFVRPVACANACDAGEIYTFDVNHGVTLSRCEGHRIVQRQHSWSLSLAEDGSIGALIAGMGNYVMSIEPPERNSRMVRLRATDSTAPAAELVLRSDED